MTAPTVNRHVNYFLGPLDSGMTKYGSGPMAAIVVHAWSDSCVNLVVFDAAGNQHNRTSVILAHDREPAGGECAWVERQPSVEGGAQ